MKKLSLNTAIGAMMIIAKGGPLMAIQKLGVTEEDFTLMTGDTVWTADIRPPIRRALEVCIYGVVDMIGLPRFELPAEYIAAIISTFVAPVNYFPACTWLAGGLSNEDIIQGRDAEAVMGFEKVTPQLLFALVVELENEADKTASAYCNKTGAKIQRLSVGAKPAK